MPNLPLSHWSNQLSDLCALSSNDIPILLLNQPTTLVTALQLCASVHNFICCAIVLSFYNPVTKVDTENTTYHCFLLRKHLHTCSSAKNKFTDQIYFTNGSKVVFFFSRWVCSFLSDTYKVLPKKYLPKLKCLSFFSFLEKKKFSLIFCGLFKWWQKL